MPVARPEPPDVRVIAHVDLDCFYVQVEQRRHPELMGKPTAVVQYNPFRGGAIIAVGYEARRHGVTRIMRGHDAKKICPDINLVQVPVAHGKADLTIYRDAGSEVVEIFSRMGICERASIDEVYLDITEAATKRLMESPPYARDDCSEEVRRTHVVGVVEDPVGTNVREWLSRSFASRSDQLLACGAIIVAELRAAVVKETQFTTSAGIAHNKMLAKLASGMHKPAQQTLIPATEVQTLLADLPTKKIKNLGGKLGRCLESDLGVKTMGDLLPYTESKLQELYGSNTGTWLWRVARGLNGEEVEGRTLPKSHGCGKTFPGPTALKNLDSIRYWLTELSAELQERLDEDLQLHYRKARLLVVHASCHIVGKASNSMKSFPSKSCVLRYGKERIASDAIQLFKRSLSEFSPDLPKLSPVKGEASGTSCTWAVTALSVGANNICEVPAGLGTITRFFGSPAASNAKDKVMGTAVSSLSSSPVSDVSNQPGGMSHVKAFVDFQDEEVISLTEPDEKILNSADASSSSTNAAAASSVVEEPRLGSPRDGDEEHSSSSERGLPASPNSYSVLTRRERLAWTQEPECYLQQQSGKSLAGPVADRPTPYAKSRSHSCKSVKRNLLDILDPSHCEDKDLVFTPKFCKVGRCRQPLSTTKLLDVASDSQQKDSMVGGSIGKNPFLESQEKSVGLCDLRDKVEVILCSPLESRTVDEGFAVESDIGQGPENKSFTIDMHPSVSEGPKLSHGSNNVAFSADDFLSKLPASLLLSSNSGIGHALPEGPLQDLPSQSKCGESQLQVSEDETSQLFRWQRASGSVTLPQTTRKHSTSLEHASIFRNRATLSSCSDQAESLVIPTSDTYDSPPPAGSVRGEDGTPIVDPDRVFSGRFKQSAFTRVDELWEKWKSACQKSTPNRGLGNGSVGGMYEQDGGRISPGVKSTEEARLDEQGQKQDHNRPKKRKNASISHFFHRNLSK